MHPPTNKQSSVFLVVFYVLNKLLRTTGFEPLYLLYRQKFFSNFRGQEKHKWQYFCIEISQKQVTTQNVSTGKLYNVRFDLFKELLKLYLLTSINHLHFFLCKFLCALILFLVTVIVCFRIRFFITFVISRYFVCAPITQLILILCLNCSV